MTFKGKISTYWYVIIGVLNGISLGGLVYLGFSEAMIGPLAFLAVVDLYFIPVLFKNEVTVDKKQVVIKFGILKKTLPTQEIQLIRSMKEHSASFAASFDRIGIESRRMSTVFVSVEDKEGFTQALLKANKKIRYVI